MTVSTLTPLRFGAANLKTPARRIAYALEQLENRRETHRLHQRYAEGNHEEPFTPPGVDAEYKHLLTMCQVPLIQTALRLFVQRLKVEAILPTTDSTSASEKATKAWQDARFDSLQSVIYTAALTHAAGGIVSVWKTQDTDGSSTLEIVIESSRNVYMHPNPKNPFGRPAWTVKRWDEDGKIRTQYVDETGAVSTWSKDSGGWQIYPDDAARLQTVPDGPYFALRPFLNDEGKSSSFVGPLIPAQRAIDTMQANLLLAAQFAAFRQRIVTNYDPVLRDADGEPMYYTDADGEQILDQHGQPIPQLVNPGRTGVDRMIVFDGDAKVFDLDESDLKNYEAAQTGLIQRFAAASHIPPPYLAGEIKNVGTGASEVMESTLLGFIEGIQTSAGEFWEKIFSHADPEIDSQSVVVWRPAQPPQTLSAAADGIGKLLSFGFPLRAGLELLPGATPAKVDRWMSWAEEETAKALGPNIASLIATKKAAALAGSPGTDTTDVPA